VSQGGGKKKKKKKAPWWRATLLGGGLGLFTTLTGIGIETVIREPPPAEPPSGPCIRYLGDLADLNEEHPETADAIADGRIDLPDGGDCGSAQENLQDMGAGG
jgi:hypothetical protein